MRDPQPGDGGRGEPGGGLAEDPDRAAERAQQAGDRQQGCRLSRAVRPEQADDLALADAQVDPVHDADAAMPGDQPFHGQ
jgi:hypothetical protein